MSTKRQSPVGGSGCAQSYHPNEVERLPWRNSARFKERPRQRQRSDLLLFHGLLTMNPDQLERLTLLITAGVMLYFLYIQTRIFGVAGLLGTLLALLIALLLVKWIS